MTEPASGLYVHVPFCSAVCPYCDFAVTRGRPGDDRAFVDHLLLEIEGLRWDRAVDTVYLGGGTPSYLEPRQLETLLDRSRQRLRVAEGTRIALEANPEDVTPGCAEAWRALGVGTVSLGVQSFDDASLRRLGRRHDGRAARRSVETCRRTGFETLSVDLIYGLPGQSPERWRADLEAAAELQPDHLSCYQLTVHAGTPFGRLKASGRLRSLPDEETEASLFRLTHEWLGERGYAAYEVSNFARAPEHRSRHNLKYWTHVPYLGIGPSAHSFDGERRWWNLRHVTSWQRALAHGRSPVDGGEVVGPLETAHEALMLGLRTTAGVDLASLRRRTGLDALSANRARLERWTAEGLIELAGERIVPTLAGLQVADSLAAALELPAPGLGDARDRRDPG